MSGTKFYCSLADMRNTQKVRSTQRMRIKRMDETKKAQPYGSS
jgi:hypothetical protein